MARGDPFRHAIGAVVRLALPPRCPACGAVTQADHHFCTACWATLRFLGPPACAGCGAPFAFDRGEGARCAACLVVPPVHAGIHAAVAYGPVARSLALGLKYAGRTAHAATMARLMLRTMPAGIDLLVPVPLHRGRLWSRGFNQAALIADAIAACSGVAVDRHVLRRARATPVLRGLGRADRRLAVRGAFALDPARAAGLKGRAVALVDDVHTSGATSEACVRLLLRGGAARVAILCWARVLDGEPDDPLD